VEPTGYRALPAVQAPAQVQGTGSASLAGLSDAELVERHERVVQAMEAVMKEGVHYGRIPGVQKPSLLKPGAEVLCSLFMLDPEFDVDERTEAGGHLSVLARCTLFHVPTGLRVGSGVGSCSTRETRYAYRKAERTCPACGAEAIIKGKAEYGGGWVCFKRKGGCGEKFATGDGAIESQEAGGRVANPDLPDSFNTVLKIATKRSLVAAILHTTGASDVFTQDVEDTAPQVVAEQRVEGPKPPPVPRSWAALMTELGRYGDLGWVEWLRQGISVALDVTIPEGASPTAGLSREQKQIAFQKACTSYLALREGHDPEEFPPPDADEIRAAFEQGFGGKIAGPPEAAAAAPDTAEAITVAEDGVMAYDEMTPEEQAEIDRIADDSFGGDAKGP
jgi:hypothetical protein